MKYQTTFLVDAVSDPEDEIEHHPVSISLRRPDCGVEACYIEIVLPDGMQVHFEEAEWKDFCDSVQEYHN